jgi:hypothetical protein
MILFPIYFFANPAYGPVDMKTGTSAKCGRGEAGDIKGQPL